MFLQSTGLRWDGFGLLGIFNYISVLSLSSLWDFRGFLLLQEVNLNIS